VPAGARGLALQDVLAGGAPARDAVYAEGVMEMASVRTATHRLVVRGLTLGDGSAERLRALPWRAFDLYDTGRDPAEQRDLLDGRADTALAERLRDRMVAWRRQLVAPDAPFAGEVPAALEKGLQAQGYWTPDAR
jgi:hypothetical protein